MIQIPAPHSFLLKWRGEKLDIRLELDSPRPGRAVFRTNLGHASIRREEIIAETERGETPMARAWTDIPLTEIQPGVFAASIPLEEVGVFSGKACFFPEGSTLPEWPEGSNLHIKVESEVTYRNNSIYTVFPRQFGSFREVVRRLPLIMDKMGFRLIQTLPPFPVPTTYAVMGEYGCPFAATDFFSVDPAMAEFDERATPLDQFQELIDAVHAKEGLFLIDLPANHTGWASTLQTHHPEWFKREADGKFISPGAWGVIWADLVALDYSHSELCAYMAEVFLFWCRHGVDGFRCDAGYMIPAETWNYIVARVREEYPDTIFMLEGLGGELALTDRLLTESGLDWAYSEIFQTYTRDQFQAYLPDALIRSENYGALVHFAETHDNDRLAKKGRTYARLRVQLAALLSAQGAWGIANGVEWYCTEKIDVHGKNDLFWGAAENMVELISQLNRVLSTDPSFAGDVHLRLVTRGGGNTLAVLRGEDVLVLANLDCEEKCAISWDLKEFSAPTATDLITGRKVKANAPIELAPGEVLCLRGPARAESRELLACRIPEADYLTPLSWNYPADQAREPVVPAGMCLRIGAASHFRVEIVDPQTGKTLRQARSRVSPQGQAAFIHAPEYEGTGIFCRPLSLRLVVYTPQGPQRCTTTLRVPPSREQARIRRELFRQDLLKEPDARTILSNRTGAASQVRLGWGRIASQYDAFLAANPNPNCPSDRVNVWTRTRCWLQREGYTREFDVRCTSSFVADPAGRFARWIFDVPCGMGQLTRFVFTLSLVPGANVARLMVKRLSSGAQDAIGSVRLVFRPDLEWRSFHSTTKAYAGAEKRFPLACAPQRDGLKWTPGEGTVKLRVANGEYHHEPEWTYNVSHIEEARRGQDPSGDLFSPGWISTDLKPEEEMTILVEVSFPGNALPSRPQWQLPALPEHPEAEKSFVETLEEAMDLFIVTRDDLKTVIAGYPWFLDWGRDTFIFMRGAIASGRIDQSLQILRAFAAFEENGTLPNIIYGKTAGNRDTTDAQLFFIRCVREIAERCGIERVSDLLPTCQRIVAAYRKGTPNGIRMDAESALIWSPSHFSWMDTNYPACTPRMGYPIDIQALWVSALDFLGEESLARQARASIERYFKRGDRYCDCLTALHGEPASRAVPDEALRPNQLFLIALGICADAAIVRSAARLLVPGGLRSLSSDHPLYRGIYAGDEDTQRKPAYHNGTVWAWTFPMLVEALYKRGDVTREQAFSLLASSVDNLNTGCCCHMSEIADGDAPHAQKGCTAQAWSVSEVLRVWLYLMKEPAHHEG